MTDDDIIKVADMFRGQLAAASPEQYRFTREVVFNLAVRFDLGFFETESDTTKRFYRLIFEDYPVDLYGR